jgi:hypothetical protein
VYICLYGVNGQDHVESHDVIPAMLIPDEYRVLLNNHSQRLISFLKDTPQKSLYTAQRFTMQVAIEVADTHQAFVAIHGVFVVLRCSSAQHGQRIYRSKPRQRQ